MKATEAQNPVGNISESVPELIVARMHLSCHAGNKWHHFKHQIQQK